MKNRWRTRPTFESKAQYSLLLSQENDCKYDQKVGQWKLAQGQKSSVKDSEDIRQIGVKNDTSQLCPLFGLNSFFVQNCCQSGRQATLRWSSLQLQQVITQVNRKIAFQLLSSVQICQLSDIIKLTNFMESIFVQVKLLQKCFCKRWKS